MPEPKQTRRSTATTPADFPVQAPAQLPGADYSYTVELVGAIQHQLGKLTEAVESLKSKSADHDRKLEDIGKDIHAAKTTLRVATAILTATAALVGWAASKAIDAYVQTHQTPASQQAKP